MYEAEWKKHTLIFKQASGTSRGVLRKKESWFFKIWKKNYPQKIYWGECGLLKGLSIDDVKNYEKKLDEICFNINNYSFYLDKDLIHFPSIRFGLEMAFQAILNSNTFELFPSDFTKKEHPIHINGLVWMGEKDFMLEQIKNKIKNGFSCIKLKIGAIRFNDELDLLQYIRKEFSEKDIEIRVDANGAFSPKDVLEKLSKLSKLKIHSIEQPIRQGQFEEMQKICKTTPIPIALDEELIGIFSKEDKENLLEIIQPQYIILKPSLVGGFKSSEEWINIAKQKNIGWWITSALESNIGLNAIAQWTYTLNSSLPQGLGTGQLYTNNFPSPLTIHQGNLIYQNHKNWDTSLLNNLSCE